MLTLPPKPVYAGQFVTLFCADALSFTPLWASADVLVMDPPYGVNFRSNKRTASAKSEKIAGDETTSARDNVLAAWGDTKPALSFGSWRAPRPAGTKQIVTWCKGNSGPGMGDLSLPWGSMTEEIYVLGDWASRQGKRTQNFVRTDVCMGNPSGLVARIGHPTPKPVELMSELLSRCPAGVVADPFAGSGSTLVAAALAGRYAIGFEIDPGYAEIAARRIAEAEATHHNSAAAA